VKKGALVVLSCFILFSGAAAQDQGGMPGDGVLRQREQKAAELLFMAKKAYEDGFYEVALGMLDRFSKEFPDSPKMAEADLLKGQSYFYQSRYLEALRIFDSLIAGAKAKGIRDALYFWTAELHFKGGNFEKAASFYQRLIDEFPASSYLPESYYSLGWAFFQMGKYEKALQNFKIVLEKFPGEPQGKDAAFKLIECLYNLKDYSLLKEKIKPVFRLYAKDAPRLPYLYFYLAESEYYTDSFKDAVSDYLESVRLFKDEKARSLAKLGLAWSYLKLNKYREAEDYFAGIRQDSLDAKSLEIFLLGKAALMSQSNRVYEAKKLYQRLIDMDADPAVRLQAYIGKAEVLYGLAEYAQSAKACTEALKYSAKLPDITADSKKLLDRLRYNLGMSYVKQGDEQSGIKAFEDIVSQSEDSQMKAEALCQEGDIYQAGGKYEEARASYARVLKQFPGSRLADYALYQTGVSYLKEKKYSQASGSFKHFLEEYPDSPLSGDASYSLGASYFYGQDYALSKDILSVFQGKLKGSRLSGQALFMMGLCLLNTGNTEGALALFKEVRGGYPYDTELAQKSEYEIADCYYKIGQEKEAVKRFERLRAKYPDSKFTPEIMWWLGQYYYRSKDLTMAKRYLGSLVRDFPESALSPDALYALGVIYGSEGDFSRAIEEFKSARDSADGQLKADSALSLADIYRQEGVFGEALKEYKRILADYPDMSPLIFPRMGECYYKTQDYAKSVLFYRKALELVDARSSGYIWFSLAEAYEARNETAVAAEAYLKSSEASGDDLGISARALLRAAKIYEDKNDLPTALELYGRVSRMEVEEAVFAEERIEWIGANK